MGACFSKRGKASPPTEVASNVPLKDNGTVIEEQKKHEPAEKSPAVTVKKNSSVAEEKGAKEEEMSVKKSDNHEERTGTKGLVTGTGPLRTSSCTKEEVDAILIECGRLSRNSSGKASNDMAGSRGQKMKGGDETDKPETRTSPGRRTPRRERSGSRERGNSGGRRVSRSPGRRTDGVASSASTCDKPRQQQPAKMVSVPATEKCAPFGNAEIEGASLAAERVSRAQSSRSRSPANSAVMSNKNAQSQSLCRSSSTKAGQSPYRRDPMTEIDENSLKNQNGRSREMDKWVNKSMQPPSIHKSGGVDEAMNNEAENFNKRTLQRTRSRSSGRSSHDFDNCPESNPISYTAFLLEDIQKNQNQEQSTVFSFPSCISKACSILETVSDLNSSCSEQRNCGFDKTMNNNFLDGGLESRGLLVRRSVRDDEPEESAGSNSFNGNSLELTSVDSGKEVGVEDEAVPVGTQQQKRSWPEPGRGQRRSGVSSSDSNLTDTAVKAATPAGKKKLNHRPLQEARQSVGDQNGEFCRRPISLPVSSATRRA